MTYHILRQTICIENYLLQGQTDGYNADAFDYNKANTGYVGEYDFNVSGNINDRIYLGMTIGINDVHYKNWSYLS